MGKYLFLDTNIYLHYKPVQELELDRFGPDCTLVVPRIILGELNKHKDSHSSRRIRNRARAICKEIHVWSDAKTVSENLAFEFLMKPSSPEKHNLDPSSNDDRFLADILEHPAPADDKVLLSNDSNLQLTAKHLGIIVEEIDDRFMLPAEPDPAEIEVRQLRRELDQLRNARPKLEVGLAVEDSHLEVEPNPVFPLRNNASELTDEEIELKVAEKRRSLEEMRIAMPTQSIVASHLSMGLSPEDIDAYNQELDAYPEKYHEYLLARRRFMLQPMYCFAIGIANTGTAPAQNIDIYLHFPDGFALYEEENVPDGPEEPAYPTKPMSIPERIARNACLVREDFRYPSPRLNLPTTFSLRRTDSYNVEDSFQVLKHNERVCLPELFLQFPSLEAAKPFRCDYRVTVDNLPEEIKGSINFQFRPVSEEGGSSGDTILNYWLG
jgi:hypothetical protein